jgi:hypothetical protein
VTDLTDEVLFSVGRVLHESRMRECYGGWQISTRRAWPATVKDFRRELHIGQPWIDVAIAQARALHAAGLLNAPAEPGTG